MHTSPDVLALLALGEEIDPAERDHVHTCPICHAEFTEIERVVGVGRTVEPDDFLREPPAAVWEAIRAELGFGQSSPSATAGAVGSAPQVAAPSYGGPRVVPASGEVAAASSPSPWPPRWP